MNDENYVEMIEKLICDLIEQNKELKLNHTKFWDYCKFHIKHYSIKFRKERSLSRSNEIEITEQELKREIEICERNSKGYDNDTIQLPENELESLYEAKAKGAQVRLLRIRRGRTKF